MGHRKQHAPRHGSLGFLPRKRARYMKGRVRNWLDRAGATKFLGFAGFKVGMTHIAYIEDQKTSPFFGKELIKPVTIVETPPLVLFGVKVYKRDDYGMSPIGEIWNKELAKELSRKIQLPDMENYKFEENLETLQGKLVDGMEIRGLFHTQPYKTCMPRIKPDIIEMKVTGGANCKDQFEYAKNLLGKEIRIRDCLTEGSMVDSIAVTKGKGLQGPLKRMGLKKLPRKNRKGQRHIGCLSGWSPKRVKYVVARAGQDGLHQRVEYHKRIMKISEDGEEINAKGGYIRYGVVRNDYLLLLGSIPGPKKRLIRLREAIRPKRGFVLGLPNITYVSKLSQQGK
jgi:large subunit ribosomal protein L3